MILECVVIFHQTISWSSATTKRPECSPWGLIRNGHYPSTATVCGKLQNLQFAKVFFLCNFHSKIRQEKVRRTVKSNKYLSLDLGSAQDMKYSSLKLWLQRLERWWPGWGWGYSDNDDQDNGDGIIIKMIMTARMMTFTHIGFNVIRNLFTDFSIENHKNYLRTI